RDPKGACLALFRQPQRYIEIIRFDGPFAKVETLVGVLEAKPVRVLRGAILRPHGTPGPNVHNDWRSIRPAQATPRANLRSAVAVGTALAGGPPHRSVRAALPHTALTSGVWRRNGR